MEQQKTRKMPGWKKRFLKVRREEKSTIDDPQEEEGSFNNAIRLLEQLRPPTEEDLASLKPGQKIRFYYFQEGSTDAFWLEGRIAQWVTKKEHAKTTNYMTNWFNLDQLKPMINFGSASSTFPNKFSINLAPHQCWELVTEINNINVFSITDDEEKVVQLDAGEVPETGGILPVKEEQQMEG